DTYIQLIHLDLLLDQSEFRDFLNLNILSRRDFLNLNLNILSRKRLEDAKNTTTKEKQNKKVIKLNSFRQRYGTRNKVRQSNRQASAHHSNTNKVLDQDAKKHQNSQNCLRVTWPLTKRARKLQLQELEEFHLKAYENSKIYKEKVKCFHDNMILRKEFKLDQKVLLFNSYLKLIVVKFRSKWDGPFIITTIFPYDVVEIRNEATDKTFKVNGHHLKLFHECPTMIEGDVEDLFLVNPTFP
ncbi:hypothetical protein CR513_60131, partial [Mucuna pruriens]